MSKPFPLYSNLKGMLCNVDVLLMMFNVYGDKIFCPHPLTTLTLLSTMVSFYFDEVYRVHKSGRFSHNTVRLSLISDISKTHKVTYDFIQSQFKMIFTHTCYRSLLPSEQNSNKKEGGW